MAETKQTVPSSSKRRGWLRKLAIAAGTLVVLLVVLYFVATSAPFFKGVILPRVGKSLNAEITVADASISPFSQVVLNGLTVKTTGPDPLLQVQEVRLRYSLRSIIGGTIKVDEVTVTSPTLNVVQNADGTSNLDPLLKKEAAPAKPSAEPSKPLQLDVRNVAFKNVKVVAVQNAKDGSRQTVELSDINITLDQLKNGAAGKLTLAASAKIEGSHGTARDSLQSKGSGSIDFTLGADLMPQTIKGAVVHEIAQAAGSFKDFAGYRTQLDCDVTPAEVKAFALSFRQGEKILGALRVSGPLDLSKLEGRLTVELSSIDRNVLNLVGAAKGWDFGSSTLGATNLINISSKGSMVSADGRLIGRRLGVRMESGTTPPLDLDFDYQVTVNLNDKTAQLQKLNLLGRKGSSELLQATLDQPMNLTWGQAQPGFKESSLKLAINKLNLADWRPFLGENPPTGVVDAHVNIAAQQDGKQLKADSTLKLTELTAAFGSNKVNRVNVQAQATARVEEFKNVVVDKYSFGLDSGGRSLISANGSANCSRTTGDLGAQITIDANLPALLQQVSVPQLTASAGTLKFTGLFSQKSGETNVSGNLAITDLTARYGDYQFQNYQATVDYGIEIKQAVASIRRLALAIRQGAASGGSFDLAGKYDLTKNDGEFTFNIVDLNQNALGPILTPALAPNRLLSISLNGKGSAGYDAKGESAVKAELKLANLVVEDPEKKLPKTPLAVDVQADGTLRKELLILKQLLVGLTPTDRAKNQLQLAGKIDLAKTNAAPSELALRAESLDVTPYYDLFAGQSKSAAPAQAKPAPTQTPAPSSPPADPDPVSLPFKQFTFDAKIDRLFLREIAVSNFVANAKVDGGKVVLNPFQLSLNGAPLTAKADLDLGVKGWTYDVGLTADKIQIEPIANSFMSESRGQYKGAILANARIKGAGTTDASLKKNLTGQVGFALTNANVQIVPSQTKILFIPINLNLIATLLNIPEIMQSPITGVDVRVNLGDGKIDLKQSKVTSPAFLANIAGVIPMADVLTNSPLNMPVELWLIQSLAQKVTLSGGGSSGEPGYAKLPTFVTVVGTIGKPDYKQDRLALGGMVLKSGVGVAEKLGVNVGGKTGDVLKGVGNLLTGQGQQTSTNTNAPAGTNPPPKRGLFDLLPKKK
jgi:AsmA-like protein